MSWSVEDDDIVFDAPKNLARELGATWKEGQWHLPASRMNARWLVELGLADGTLIDALAPPGGAIAHDRLYDYQREAASRLVAARHGAMLVMPPGLGKTATAIVAADAYTTQQVVVVTLPTLMKTWQREIEAWSERREIFLLDRKVTDAMSADAALADWVIVSWDRVVADPELFVTKDKWPVWIIDENVLAKSRSAHRKLVFSGGNVKKDGQITKHYPGLRKSVGRIWMLSASPTTRHSDDLWGSLSILWPRAYRSYWRFAERYCTVEVTPWAKTVTGDRPGVNAAEDNDDVVIVVTPQVDIPEYVFAPRQDVALLPRQRGAFEQMTKDFIAELSGGRQVVANNEIAKLVRLQQIVSYWDGESAKAEAVLRIMEGSDPPWLIWTHWVDGAEYLHERLILDGHDGYYVNGTTKLRDEKIEAYKNGAVEYLIMSLGVGKFGHTLVNTVTEIRVDKTFNSDDYFQSFHRVRRIGLRHRPTLFTLHAPGTTDDIIDMNQEAKMQSISKLTRGDLAALLKGLGR